MKEVKTFRIEEEKWKKLDNLAKKLRTTRGDLLRSAVGLLISDEDFTRTLVEYRIKRGEET